MKRVVLFLSLTIMVVLIPAQSVELWGTFSNSNRDNLGSIFKIDSTSRNAKIVKTFNLNASYGLGLLKAQNGVYYGIRASGGDFGNGAIYSVNLASNTTKEIHQINLNNPNGEISGDLIEAVPGELWGMAANAGINDAGVIFKYNYVTNVFTVVFNINAIGTDNPNGSLVKAPNGNLYGLARGIANFSRRGSIFEIDLTSNTITNRYNFPTNGNMGNYPGGKLTYANNRLYGVCGSGGGSFNGSGTLYEYNYTTHTVLRKKVFNASNSIGDYPSSSLLLGSNGNLYGTTSNGGVHGLGVIYEYTPGTFTMTKNVDLDSALNYVQLDMVDGNRILGFSLNNFYADDYSNVVEFIPATNSLNQLTQYNGLLRQTVYKDSVDGYYIGGDKIIKYDSSFSQSVFITEDSKTHDGGKVESSLTLASDGKLYGYSKEFHKEQTIFRIDPVTYKYEVVKRFQEADSVWGIEGKILNHPNGNLYVAYSEITGRGSRPSGYTYQSGILEIETSSSTVSEVYQFDNNIISIKSLVLDDSLNFYGVGHQALGSQSYFFKLSHAFNSLTILRTWGTSYSLFFSTDLMVDSNDIYGLFNDSGGAKMFKYSISQNTFLNRSISNGVGKGGFLKGSAGNYYCLADNKIYKYNSIANQVTIEFDINANSTIAGRIPSTLNIHNNILYGITTAKSFSNYNNSVFSYDPSAAQNKLKLIHEFDSADGRSSFAPTGINPIIVEVCRSSDQPALNANVDSLCSGGQFEVTVTSGNINSGDFWALYDDTLAAPLQIDSTGVFNLLTTSSKRYFVKGEGSCFSNSSFNSIEILVDSNYFVSSIQNVSVCKKDNFVRPGGDTIFTILSSFVDTTFLTSKVSGCDSVVYTSVNVDTVNVGVQQNNNYSLFAQDSSMVYQWVDCNTNLPIASAVSQEYVLTQNGSFAVEIDNGICKDTSACISVISVGIQHNVLLLNVTMSPNPTTGLINIKLGNVAQNGFIQVRNIQGQLIQKQQFNNQSNLELEIEGKAGVYFIQLTNEKGEWANMKVVKQ